MAKYDFKCTKCCRTEENLFLIDSQNGEGYDNIIQTIKDENGLEW